MLAEVIKLAMPYKVRQYREAVQGPRSEGAENTPQPPPHKDWHSPGGAGLYQRDRVFDTDSL